MATTTSAPSTARETTDRAVPTLLPPVDIVETDTAFIVLADMPGVAPDGLEVVTERDALVIRGRAERSDTQPDYQEFELGEYRRTFLMTEDLDTSGIQATLRDGVLRVEIPKSERLKPKKIPVRGE
jgi:HSP20 family protein